MEVGYFSVKKNSVACRTWIRPDFLAGRLRGCGSGGALVGKADMFRFAKRTPRKVIQ